MRTLESLLKRVENLRVLLVGDTIIDEYVYVRPQGKSPKENIITNRVLRSERFRGGVWAAAKHVGGLCEQVEVFTGGPSILKRRFVEDGYLHKLFETHEECDEPLTAVDDFRDYDIVIVTDFGHGFVTKAMIEELTRRARFLAVNAQTNSANHGFNLITKYPRADYVVLDELEARLAVRDRDSPIEHVVEALDFPRVIVTLGPNGSCGFHHGEVCRAPAMKKNVVDTMGAGDAFFCVTAPFAAVDAEIQALCTIGNAAGAIKCGVVGHRTAVTREDLLGNVPLEVRQILEGLPEAAPAVERVQ